MIFGASANNAIAQNIAIGDMNNDGYPDIAMSSIVSTTYVVQGSVVLLTSGNTYSASHHSHSQLHESYSTSHHSRSASHHSHSHASHSVSHHSHSKSQSNSHSKHHDVAHGSGASTSSSEFTIIGAVVGGVCAIGLIAAVVYMKNKKAAAAAYAMQNLDKTNAFFVGEKTKPVEREECNEECKELCSEINICAEQDTSLYS